VNIPIARALLEVEQERLLRAHFDDLLFDTLCTDCRRARHIKEELARITDPFVVVVSEPSTYEDSTIDPVVGPFASEQEARDWGFTNSDGFHIKMLVS
jgi:hypothetical protein